ncbi:thioredoxin [Methanolobus sp.]|uniref:thioredoxin n=1 Tax=Methanolobus sp. TaxID=1874737 RepID=UPI0025DE5215|nr:thioredoxin [Methanolobus sp.]
MDEIDEIRQRKMEDLKKELEKREHPGNPVEVTDAAFDEFTSKYNLTVVDCWAQWCGPCRMISPIIDELASELQGKVVFGKLNVDANKSTAGKYAITSIPALLVFKNGKLVDRIIGAVPKQRIVQRLQPLM